MPTVGAASDSVLISLPANYRRPSCRRKRGRLQKAAATGHWWDARSRRVLILPRSNWPSLIGSPAIDKCIRESGGLVSDKSLHPGFTGWRADMLSTIDITDTTT